MNIYVDVLFVLNFFITYLLLLFTGVLSKAAAKTYRLLSASFIGGVYSLTIFVDRLHFLLTVFGKLFASILIVLTAFGFVRGLLFLKRLLIFYFSNLLFLGIIVGIQLIFHSNAFKVNNSILYFDVSAAALIFSALFAYLISTAIIKIHNRLLSQKEIYVVKIFKQNREYTLYAFADSGNKLHEPFTGYPVIIADEDKVKEECDRVIPYNTVGGDGMLKAFKPDKVIINVNGRGLETDKVYVALSKLSSKDFSLVLNLEILEGG